MPLIMKICDASPLIAAALERKGAFLFTIAAIEDRSDIELIKFLHKYHLRQDETATRNGESVLSKLLPFPMIRYITLNGSEAFRDVLDGELQQPV
jgi:hypothetical protein